MTKDRRSHSSNMGSGVIQGDLSALIRKRGTIKARITKFKESISVIEQIRKEAITKKQISDLNLRLKKMNELFTEFESVQTQIESSDSESNLDKRLQERFDLENQFFSVISSAQEIVSAHEERVDSPSRRLSVSSNCCNHGTSQLKLPTINMPSFDGNYSKWLEFRDMFDSLINKLTLFPISVNSTI